MSGLGSWQGLFGERRFSNRRWTAGSVGAWESALPNEVRRLGRVFLVLCAFGFGRGAAHAAEHLLWYPQPASGWHEALPVGNGRLGAMVYGGTATE